MKFSVHLSMLCKKWTDDVTVLLPKLAEFGYNAVELSLFGADKSTLLSTAKKINANGLDLTCGTGLGENQDLSSAEKKQRENAINYIIDSVKLVNECGGKILNGVLYAPWQGFSPEIKNERWKRAAESFSLIDPMLKKYNVSLNLEVLNRFESDFMNTLEEGSEFLKMVNSENIKLLADTFHMNIEESNMLENIDLHWNNIGIFHICENHRGVPSTGNIDWKSFLSLLKRKNYKGYLTLESFVEKGTQVGNALFIWRNLGKSPIEEAEKSIKYLKTILEEIK